MDLLQILIAINLQDSSIKELYLQEWDFSQDSVINVLNTYLSDLCWFSVNFLTLRVNRETFEAFAWKLKNNVSVSHCVTEERSALEDICTLSLYQLMDQNSPPEFLPEWITRINNMEGAEGSFLRKRLNCKIIRQQDDQGMIVHESYEYGLPIIRMVTTGMRRSDTAAT